MYRSQGGHEHQNIQRTDELIMTNITNKNRQYQIHYSRTAEIQGNLCYLDSKSAELGTKTIKSSKVNIPAEPILSRKRSFSLKSSYFIPKFKKARMEWHKTLPRPFSRESYRYGVSGHVRCHLHGFFYRNDKLLAFDGKRETRLSIKSRDGINRSEV